MGTATATARRGPRSASGRRSTREAVASRGTGLTLGDGVRVPRSLIRSGKGSPAHLSASPAMVGSISTGIAAQILLVASGAIVARALGPENRGVLALIFVLVGIVTQMGTLGVPSAVTYWIASRETRPEAILRALRGFRSLQLTVVLAVQVGLIFLILAPRTAASMVWIGGLSLVATAAAVSQLYGLAVLQGLRRFGAFNAVRLMNGALYTVAVVGLWAADAATLTSVTLATVAAAVVAAAATWLAVSRVAPSVGSSAVLPRRAMVGFGLRSLLGSAPPVETFRLDQLLVGLVLSPLALGYYVVAIAFTNLSRLVGQSIGMVTFPRVTATQDREEQLRLVRADFLLGCVVCGLATAALIVGVPRLLPFFFGSEFEPGVLPAQVLLAGAFFASVRRILVDATRGSGWPLWGAVAEAVTLAVVPGIVVVSLLTDSLTAVAVIVAAANLGGLIVVVPALSKSVYRRARSLDQSSRADGRRAVEPRPLADDAT
jgi:O-antigen/teichoic acid export membrane protein